MISLAEAKKLNERGNVIPVAARIPSDLETPVSAFMKLAEGRSYSFLLESIEGGEKLARYSFIGVDPFLLIEGTRTSVTLRKNGDREWRDKGYGSGEAEKKGGETYLSRTIEANPIEFLDELFRVYRPVEINGLPRFHGGAVGYFSYDCARWVERIPDTKPDMVGLPEMMFGMFQTIVAFDHLKQEIVVIANILHENGEQGFRAKYDGAVAQVDSITERLRQPLRIPEEPTGGRAQLRSLTSQKEYEGSVRRAKRYIREGDIFQVVLSRRWEIETAQSALSVYRRLRRINPSPYMFLLSFGDNAVVGSSPEMMVRVENGQIETRPIAGTRPRGANDAEDEKRVKDLLADEKELAEHTMLLDLGRNDIGRVSRPGSVRVKDQMIIEKYSHVIHIVSSVVGKLSAGTSPLEGHFACFPAGTVSGAPKIRAMEIIDELESHRRGLYAGSVAYLDFWGNLDSCIAIRTVVKKGKSYFVQAGAGIVADSKPTKEYFETEAKAGALIQAVMGESCR